MSWISFRKIFDLPNLRIFINATRIDETHADAVADLRKVLGCLRKNDRIIWLTFWHADQAYFDSAAAFFREASVLSLDHIWVMGNTFEETNAALRAGFRAAWVNHNAWLDERLIFPKPVKKEFRAVMVSQLVSYKRVHLAAKIKQLAVIPSRRFPIHQEVDISHFVDARRFDGIKMDEVMNIINASRVGLILSAVEGACYSSSEYLLNGIPVVSTPSLGGRDVFYNDYNSLIVEPDENEVCKGVEKIINRRVDPMRIFQDHVGISKTMRQTFITEVLGRIFNEEQVSENPNMVFESIFSHKMISYVPVPEAMTLVTKT